MTLSAYKKLKELEEIGGPIPERLKGMGLYEIFRPLAEKREGLIFNQIFFWILDSFSNESEQVISGEDWVEKGRALAVARGVDRSEIQLVNNHVRQTVYNWLKYQHMPLFTHLVMLKEQYRIMRDGAIEEIPKYLGKFEVGIDYDQMFRNGEYADKLSVRITKQERLIKDTMQTNEQAVAIIVKKEGVKAVSLDPGANTVVHS